MARGVNKAILIGNLGADPEVRYTPGGSAVANLTLATSSAWRDKSSGELQERTEWHRIVFFNRLAEIVGEYLHKGSKVYVEGIMKVQEIIISRNNLIENSLNKIGSEIAEQIERIKLASKSRQDEVGPQLQSDSESTIVTIIVFSLIVIGVGVFLSYFISNLIRKPIGGEPAEMANIVQAVSKGDLTYQFKNIGNETGKFLSINVFNIFNP